MIVNVRWVTSGGKWYVRISGPGNPGIILTPEMTWQLREALGRVMLQSPPPQPDNDQHDD